MNRYNLGATSILTQPDIVAIAGKPVLKKVVSRRRSDSTPLEEWVYYLPDTNTEEHYFFKDKYLTKIRHICLSRWAGRRQVKRNADERSFDVHRDMQINYNPIYAK